MQKDRLNIQMQTQGKKEKEMKKKQLKGKIHSGVNKYLSGKHLVVKLRSRITRATS